MLRVYVNAIVGLSEARQIAMAREAGFNPDGANAPIYIEKRGGFPKERDMALASLRSTKKERDVLGVARLAVLARDRKELRAVLADLRERGMAVQEFATGRTLEMPSDWPEALLDAVHYWTSRSRTFGNKHTAAEAGSQGGKEAAKRRSKQRMPKTQAAEIYLDPRLTVDQALEKINGDATYQLKWSASTLWRAFGPKWKRNR
jgi:hypothetical protein